MASAGDGDKAWIKLDLGSVRSLAGWVSAPLDERWHAIMRSITIMGDDGKLLGPFPVDLGLTIIPFTLKTRTLKISAAKTHRRQQPARPRSSLRQALTPDPDVRLWRRKNAAGVGRSRGLCYGFVALREDSVLFWAMRFDDVAIPAGLAWSSPFAKWQGSLAEVSSLDLAAAVTTRALADRGVDVGALDGLVLAGRFRNRTCSTAPPPWPAGSALRALTGPMVAQACATSVAALVAAAGAVGAGSGPQLVVTTDRTSNGPTLLYPQPSPRAAPRAPRPGAGQLRPRPVGGHRHAHRRGRRGPQARHHPR